MSRIGRAILKSLFPKDALDALRNGRNLPFIVSKIEQELHRLDANQQYLLRYADDRQLPRSATQRIEFLRREFKVFSQNEEDGILQYLFAKIGVTDRTFVEIGIQNGRECNTAHLSINCGWSGWLIEGSKEDAIAATMFYGSLPEILPGQVSTVESFVTAENINSVLQSNGVRRTVDLLSIDIDGNDYWVWKAISTVVPRVVVIEYNASFGVERRLTVPYDPEFRAFDKHPSGYYHGASLAALVNLGRAKGYIFVGCGSSGVNAYFVDKEAAEGKLHELSVEEAFYPIAKFHRPESLAEQFERIRHLEFVEV